MSIEIEHIKPNFTKVNIGTVMVWFSYDTPIAFRASGERVVQENIWSTTTGKHLNAFDGGTKEAKAHRVSSAEFNRALEEI